MFVQRKKNIRKWFYIYLKYVVSFFFFPPKFKYLFVFSKIMDAMRCVLGPFLLYKHEMDFQYIHTYVGELGKIHNKNFNKVHSKS